MGNENEKKDNKKEKIIIAILVAIIIIILLLLGLKSCSCAPKVDNNPNYAFEDGEQWDGKDPVSGKVSEGCQEVTTFVGYSDVHICKNSPDFTLVNKAENTVYLQYVGTDESGNELFNTDLLAPDKMLREEIFSKLSKGEHTIHLSISAYDVNDMSACNGYVQDVKVIVE